MKGISASVSRALSHLDLPFQTNQAIGKPAIRSTIETNIAIAKEA